MKLSSTYCLTIIISNKHYEPVFSILQTLGMLGCEEQTVPGGVKLGVYFKNEETALAVVESIKSQLNIPEFSIVKVDNRDWNAKWRESMKPAVSPAAGMSRPCGFPRPDRLYTG